MSGKERPRMVGAKPPARRTTVLGVPLHKHYHPPALLAKERGGEGVSYMFADPEFVRE